MRGNIILCNDKEDMSLHTVRYNNINDDIEANTITINLTRFADYFNGIILEGSYKNIDKIFLKISHSDTSIELLRCPSSSYHYNIFGDPNALFEFDPAHGYYLQLDFISNKEKDLKGVIGLFYFKN